MTKEGLEMTKVVKEYGIYIIKAGLSSRKDGLMIISFKFY